MTITMKKYIQPTTDMIVISAEHQLLAGSNNLKGGVTGLDGVTVENTDYAGGNADARRSSIWGDEEDF